MQKLGMKPVPGVSRVTIKKSKNVCIWQRYVVVSIVKTCMHMTAHPMLTSPNISNMGVNHADIVCDLQARCLQITGI